MSTALCHSHCSFSVNNSLVAETTEQVISSQKDSPTGIHLSDISEQVSDISEHVGDICQQMSDISEHVSDISEHVGDICQQMSDISEHVSDTNA